MKVRSRAPLRLGLAGGGTDLSPFCDEHGGAVLNATINMFVHVTIESSTDLERTTFASTDLGVEEYFYLSDPEAKAASGKLLLHKAVYIRLMAEFSLGAVPLIIRSHSDAPAGSGLGGSSTLVVALVEAFRQYFSLPLGEYDIARLAFEIEREDCRLSGGKQDQYAAAFGGFNFMEFYDAGRVVVNPLRIRRHIIHELECSMQLFFLGVSRSSAAIIDDQIKAAEDSPLQKLEAMHRVKDSAYKIKELMLKSDIVGMAEEFRNSWEAKKLTSDLIANETIYTLEQRLYDAGAWAFKVSGAGGGGFAVVFMPPEKRHLISATIKSSGLSVSPFQFYDQGVSSWTV